MKKAMNTLTRRRNDVLPASTGFVFSHPSRVRDAFLVLEGRESLCRQGLDALADRTPPKLRGATIV